MFHDDDTGPVFRDMLLLTLFGFVAMVIIMIFHLNSKEQASEEIQSPGNVIIEAVWEPAPATHDIDLWARAPNDMAVGYANLRGQVFSLLRDDLGSRNDATGINYENMYSRGTPAGEYVVNVHMYRVGHGKIPARVNVTVSVKKNATTRAVQILTSTVELNYQGQEITVFRFTLDENGDLDQSSISKLPVQLRGKYNAPGDQ